MNSKKKTKEAVLSDAIYVVWFGCPAAHLSVNSKMPCGSKIAANCGDVTDVCIFITTTSACAVWVVKAAGGGNSGLLTLCWPRWNTTLPNYCIIIGILTARALTTKCLRRNTREWWCYDGVRVRRNGHQTTTNHKLQNIASNSVVPDMNECVWCVFVCTKIFDKIGWIDGIKIIFK